MIHLVHSAADVLRTLRLHDLVEAIKLGTALPVFGSGLLGAGSAAGRAPRVQTIRLQQSAYGNPIPLVYGANRVPGYIIWLGDYKAQQHSGSGGKGGSGATSTYTYTCSYITALGRGPAAGIGQLWVSASPNKRFTPQQVAEYYYISLGTFPQDPWPYIVGAHPGQDLGYNGIVFTAAANAQLGSAPDLQQANWELIGLLSYSNIYGIASISQSGSVTTVVTTRANPFTTGQSVVISNVNPPNAGTDDGSEDEVSVSPYNGTYTITVVNSTTFTFALGGGLAASQGGTASVVGVPVIVDAEPSAIIADYLTNTFYGACPGGFPLGSMMQYMAANVALGLFLSPIFDTQQNASDGVNYILNATMAEATWVDGELQIVPYYDQEITGNGATFVPSLTPIYTFQDTDLCLPDPDKPDEPVIVTRIQPADVMNEVRIEFSSRGNDYKFTTAHYSDQAQINLEYFKVAKPETIHAICNGSQAQFVCALKLSRIQNVINKYQFAVSQRWIGLRPLDIVALNISPTDSFAGLQNVIVRITDVEIAADVDQAVKITAEDIGVCNAPYSTMSGASGAGGNISPLGNPPGLQLVNQPLIVEPTASMLVGGALEIWIALSGALGNFAWGGADIYVSEDGGNTYYYIGQQIGPATQGDTLTDFPAYAGANPDDTDTLEVDLSESDGTVESVSEALAGRAPYYNLAVVCAGDGTYDDPEFLSFADVAAGANPNQFDLSTIFRGLFNSDAVDHPEGSLFAYLNNDAIVDPGIFRWTYPSRDIGQTLYFKFISIDATGTTAQLLANATAYPYFVRGTAGGGGTGSLRAWVGTGPATGTAYIPGDIIINPSLTAGGWAGIMCIGAGVDVGATWVEFGILGNTRTLGTPGTASRWIAAVGTVSPGTLYTPPQGVIYAATAGGWSGALCSSAGPGGSGPGAAAFNVFGPLGKVVTPVAVTGPLPTWNVAVATEVPFGAHDTTDAYIYPSVTAGGWAGTICSSGGNPGMWAEFLPVGGAK